MSEQVRNGSVEGDTLRQQFDAWNAMMHTFYDWRHRIMVRFVVVVAAVAVAFRYLGTSEADPWFTVGLFVAASALSVAAALMDRVNQRFMRLSYKSGSSVEKMQHLLAGGFFQTLHNNFGEGTARGLRYNVILGCLYWGFAVGFFVAAGVAVVEL